MPRSPPTQDLPTYAHDIMSRVLEKTGYPLLVHEEEGIGYDSELRLARSGRPVHELAYVPEYRPFRVHFAVNAALKVLRIWDVPPEDRYLPAYDVRRRLPPEDHADLQRKFPWLPLDELDQLSRFLYHGLTRQLTSMPVDIRVERELADHLPEHRPSQRAYLERQIQDLEPHFLPEIAAVSPPRLYRAATAMNVALVDEFSELTGKSAGALARSSLHRALGERLRERLHSVPEPRYLGDRTVTDLWARELELEGWYTWMNLDDPP